MMRRTDVLILTALLVIGAAVAGVATASAGTAPTTPRIGTVACAAEGWTKFRPFLGSSPGRGQKPINPDVDSKWKVRTISLAARARSPAGTPGFPTRSPAATC